MSRDEMLHLFSLYKHSDEKEKEIREESVEAKKKFAKLLFEVIEEEGILSGSVWDIEVRANGSSYTHILPFLSIGEVALDINLTKHPIPKLSALLPGNGSYLLPGNGSYEIPMKMFDKNFILNLSCHRVNEPVEEIEGLLFEAEGTMYFTYDRERSHYRNINDAISLDLILELADRLDIKINPTSLDEQRNYIKGLVAEYDEMFDRISNYLE